MSPADTILLVDDEDALRWNMRAFLEDLGFQVLEASRGSEAVRICREQVPSLVLLDINMPEMDGFEVCRHLKADPQTVEIPVIFVSAFLRVADKVNAFQCGGVDYVTKPFHFAEVEARVRAHLDLHRQRRELKEQHEALRQLEAQRDGFTHMMAHDMRSPLMSIMGYLDLVLEDLPPEDSALAKDIQRARSSAERLNDMITQMLELSRLEAGSLPLALGHWDLGILAQETAETLRSRFGSRRFRLSADEGVVAKCDAALVQRILGNLLTNAIKFTPENGAMEIRINRSNPFARIEVQDNGPGIPPELHGAIFNKFGQASPELRSKGFGLGLAFCKLAVEMQQGAMGLVSEPGKGSTFWFTLPLDGSGEG